jgi:hypothetical protein
MKKFQSNVNRELSRAYPDRRRLETQCLSIISFVKSESDVLECPIWVMIVNVVAMDMLKSKLPPGETLFRAFDYYANFSSKTTAGHEKPSAAHYCTIIAHGAIEAANNNQMLFSDLSSFVRRAAFFL